jgi:lysozyme family protein
MTASNFLACFNETESFEGGYVDNPHDPGGATLKGVTQAVYTAWRRSHNQPDAAVRFASDADIQAIYRAQYWDAVRGDDLFVGLDLMMVDTGWGSGPVTAIKMLQRAVSVTADGQFGIMTLAAVKAKNDQVGLINVIAAARSSFFHRLVTWRWFGAGWTNRLNGVHAKALAMNAATPQRAIPP